MLTIMEVTPDFAPVIAAIIRTSFQAQAQLLQLDEVSCPRYVAFETTERIQAAARRGERLAVAFSKGTALGTVRYHHDSQVAERGFISRLAVLPEFRGNGYGEKLLRFAEARLQALKVNEIEIAIVAEFTKLQHFYERLGYQPRQVQTFSGLPFAVLIMTKRLPE